MLSGVVDGIVCAALAGEDELGDGDEGVALLKQSFKNPRQSLRGMLGGVVEQDDGAGLDLGGDPLGDLGGRKVLPVQTIYVPNRGKPLGHLFFRGCSTCPLPLTTV